MSVCVLNLAVHVHVCVLKLLAIASNSVHTAHEFVSV